MAHSNLDAFIQRMSELRNANEAIAKEAEKGVLQSVRGTASQGQAPDGTPWPALAEGGGQPLAGAAAAIQSSTSGSQVILKIGEPWVYHQHGAGGSSQTERAVKERERKAKKHAKKGTHSKFHAPQRKIIPEAGDPIPAGAIEAIETAAKKIIQGKP